MPSLISPWIMLKKIQLDNAEEDSASVLPPSLSALPPLSPSTPTPPSLPRPLQVCLRFSRFHQLLLPLLFLFYLTDCLTISYNFFFNFDIDKHGENKDTIDIK